jgi:hypothetical protein
MEELSFGCKKKRDNYWESIAEIYKKVIKITYEEKLWYDLEKIEDKLSIKLLIMLKLEDL